MSLSAAALSCIADPDLERAILHARSQGRPREALALADRLCRLTARPTPDALLIRATALAALGRMEAALADAARVLGIDPDHAHAAAFILRHARQPQARRAAAEIVLASSGNDGELRAALLLVRTMGARSWAVLRPTPEGIEGWAAWERGATARLAVTAGQERQARDLSPAPDHPLAGIFGHACAIRMPLPPGPLLAQVNIEGTVRAAVPVPAPPAAAPLLPCTQEGEGQTCIILLAGDDPVAAGRCVGDLMAYRPAGTRVMVAAAAAPPPDMAAFLARISQAQVEVLHAPAGTASLGAIPLALARAGRADLLLLEAGTVIQAGTLERLRAAAHSAPDIALAVPLSNTGPFVGLPHPFGGPPPARDRMAHMDRVAARVNAGAVRDLPTGTGHCLYLTRRGLDAVPFLSGTWDRLDLEAAHHGLRARALGWRTVCAGDVFVGHADTPAQAGPARRHLARLAARFPGHAAAGAAFAGLDPLADLRAAIAAALPHQGPPPLLRVVGPRLAAAARMLPDDGAPRLLLELEGPPDAPVARVTLENAIGPWRLPFPLATHGSLLVDLLRHHRIRAIEMIGFELLPDGLWPCLCALQLPIGLRLLDLRMLHADATQRLCPPYAVAHLGPIQAANDRLDAALRRLPQAPVHRLAAPLRPFHDPFAAQAAPAGGRLAILSPVASAAAHRLTHALLARRPPRDESEAVFIFGPALDEASLLSRPFVYPLGRVEADDVPELVERHGISRLLVADPQALGHPLVEAGADVACPMAVFSTGESGSDNDLILEMNLSAEDAAARICNWMESPPPDERHADLDALSTA